MVTVSRIHMTNAHPNYNKSHALLNPTPDEHSVNFLPMLKSNILDLGKPKSRAPVQ